MDVPAELRTQLSGRTFQRVGLGESGAEVWRCTMPGLPALYLKTAAVSAQLGLLKEAERLRWMQERGLDVPAVAAYHCISDTEYLMMEEVLGVPASDPSWLPAVAEMVTILGRSLLRLHSTSIADCPFNQRVAAQIAEVRARIGAGHVREDDFDEERVGRPVAELFDELVGCVPASEDLVFTHGDFCLPNVILRRDPHDGRIEMSGVIDCGRAGVADRYQDIALAVRSIAGNFGSEWVAPFLQAYGLRETRADKLHFYALLDEFF